MIPELIREKIDFYLWRNRVTSCNQEYHRILPARMRRKWFRESMREYRLERAHQWIEDERIERMEFERKLIVTMKCMFEYIIEKYQP